MHWDTNTIQGAYVGIQDGKRQDINLKSIRSNSMAQQSGKHNPLGREQIWMSSSGNIKWSVPTEEESMTFEERTMPASGTMGANDGDIMESAMLLGAAAEHDMRRCCHGLIIEEPAVSESESEEDGEETVDQPIHWPVDSELSESDREEDWSMDAGDVGETTRSVTPSTKPDVGKTKERVVASGNLDDFQDSPRCAMDLRPFMHEGMEIMAAAVKSYGDVKMPNLDANKAFLGAEPQVAVINGETSRRMCDERARDVLTKTKTVTARDVEWVLGPWIGQTKTIPIGQQRCHNQYRQWKVILSEW